MSYDAMSTCAALTLTLAIEDMAAESGKTIDEIRKDILESKAYECLLDFDSALQAEGPDYFRDYYKKVSEKTS